MDAAVILKYLGLAVLAILVAVAVAIFIDKACSLEENQDD